MNTQRGPGVTQFSNTSFDKPLSSVSQVQNSSVSFIKPLAYPCRYHPDQICQNYCIEQKCFQALCSQCIEQHLLHHKKTGLNDLYVKSFKSVRTQCSSKLTKIIDKLFSKLGILNQPKNPQEMLEDSDRQMQAIRLHMHEVIDQQFSKIREAIRQKVSQNFSIVKELSDIHENLIKIINQLKEHNTIISEGIIDPPINVGDSIQKTLMLNENALMEMFEKQSWKYDQKFRNINVQLNFSQGDFRQAVLGSLKIGTSNPPNIGLYKGSSNSKVSNFGSNNDTSRIRSRSKSPINDKSLENTSIKKQKMSNANYPVLHYFETGENALHIIDLKGQPQRTSIRLGNFIVPTFHASLLSQKTGSIFISGGNIELTQNKTKSEVMSKFQLISNDFKRDFAEVIPRSSHTLCEDFSSDCIYVLGGYGQNPESENQESITTFQTSVERVNLKNGNVEEVASSNFGGTCIAVMLGPFIIKACMQGIEVFDSLNNYWTQISRIKGLNIEGVFYRGAGYSLLDGNTILIYGGYDENQQSREQCYLMNCNIDGQSLKNSLVEVQKVNCVLPIAQGFWNNPGIFYHNFLWAIQNVQDQEGEPVEQQRTLLRLDIELKKWEQVKFSHKPKKN